MKIDNVEIKNFKSLKYLNLDLKELNIITGVNSSGKSSFIQTLLLLKQNWEFLSFHTVSGKLLSINGEFIRLGNKQDILFQNVFDENIEIKISSETKKEVYIHFNHQTLKFKTNYDLTEHLINGFNISNAFQYIQTDRITPNIFYDLSDEFISVNNIGTKGEFVAHYLAEKRHQKLFIKELKHHNSITDQLLENVSYWLGEISTGIEVIPRIYNELQKVNLTYKYTYGDNTTSDYSPLNVGFGLTYVLPIIVAILKAKKGDLIIIENPETHLHPKAQSKIAKLCALASSNGVQIIVETHSDHFFNGIRIAIKEGILTSEQSKIYYFRKELNKLETIIDEISINKNGSVNKYPKGFFDQFDNDLDTLLDL